jgi:FMN-dependent NADH-azoreductase
VPGRPLRGGEEALNERVSDLLQLLTAEHEAATALAAGLVDELVGADALLWAVPLYNFGVSPHVKTYIDLVMTDPRAGNPDGGPLLAGKPTVLVTVRGGAYGPGAPREGWDHATGYLRRILVDVWGADLTVVEREFTLVGVNPALDDFTEVAVRMQAEATAAGHRAGRELARSSTLMAG